MMIGERQRIDIDRRSAEDAIIEPFLHLPARPDVKPALEKLAGSDIEIVSLTNSTAECVTTQFESAGIIQYFDRRISTERRPHDRGACLGSHGGEKGWHADRLLPARGRHTLSECRSSGSCHRLIGGNPRDACTVNQAEVGIGSAAHVRRRRCRAQHDPEI